MTFHTRIAEMYKDAWFRTLPPVESDRVHALASRGMENPPRLSRSEIQELASAVAAFHNRRAR